MKREYIIDRNEINRHIEFLDIFQEIKEKLKINEISDSQKNLFLKNMEKLDAHQRVYRENCNIFFNYCTIEKENINIKKQIEIVHRIQNSMAIFDSIRQDILKILDIITS